MNLLRIVLRLRLQEPVIAISNDGQPRAMCCKCRSGQAELATRQVTVCAVNVLRPTEEDLEVAGNRPAYALHDYRDFELKPQPKSRTIQLH